MRQLKLWAGIAAVVAVPNIAAAQTMGATSGAAAINVTASCLGDQAQAASLTYTNLSRQPAAGIHVVWAGDRVRFQGGIKNPCTSGTREIPYHVVYGSTIVRHGKFTLAPGETKLVNHEWTAVRGNHTFKIVVDPTRTLNETSRGNNTRGATISVVQ